MLKNFRENDQIHLPIIERNGFIQKIADAMIDFVMAAAFGQEFRPIYRKKVCIAEVAFVNKRKR